MSTNHPQSLWVRLPVSLQQVLENDAHSPLQQWLNSACYDGAALLRYASTLTRDDAYAVILSAAVASVVDAALEGRPVNMHYAVPLWYSLAQGEVTTGIFVGDAPTWEPAGETAHFSGISTAHIALGLAQGKVLDVNARERLLHKAIHDPTPIHSALIWFCIDRDVQGHTPEASQSSKYLTEWMRAFPEDQDFAIFLLRKYLASARRIGVAGALEPLQAYDQPTLSPKEAAWSIAWDEAARAGAHATCADLALHRARARKNNRRLYQRWLFIYALHAEQRKIRQTTDIPVARELLDLLYEVDDPNIPAQLCASIAARTNRLEPVMREVLPYLQGPTRALVHRGLDATTRPQAFLELEQQGTAGTLLAIRIARKHPKAFQAARAYTPAKAASSRPTPILDDYETNADFMREIFPADPPETTTSRPDSAQPSTDSAPTTEPPTKEPTTADPAAPAEPASQTPEESPPPTASPAPNAPSTDSTSEESTGPFDHTIFATLTSEEFSDKTLVAAPNDAVPEISDVLLAAFLPDALRTRADQLLAQRITPKQLETRPFVRAIEERIALLPHSAWSLAELLATQPAPHKAKKWMKRAAEHTPDPELRAERYRRLAKHSAQQCHDLSSAVSYLEQSLQDAPSAPDTIRTLDTIYTRLGRLDALRTLYVRALESNTPALSKERQAKWKQRLQELRDMPQPPESSSDTEHTARPDQKD